MLEREMAWEAPSQAGPLKSLRHQVVQRGERKRRLKTSCKCKAHYTMQRENKCSGRVTWGEGRKRPIDKSGSRRGAAPSPRLPCCLAKTNTVSHSPKPSPLKISPFLGCICPSLIGAVRSGWEVWGQLPRIRFSSVGAVQSCSICVEEEERGEYWICQAGSRPTAGPTPTYPSTHLHTQSGCDKTLSVTVLLCASGRYGKVKYIWRREATIWSRSPSSCKDQHSLPSTCPFLSPALKPWPQERTVSWG